MIVILSNYGDSTTNEVVSYLNRVNVPVLRINDNSIFNSESNLVVDVNNLNIEYNNTILKHIDVVWDRKFGIVESADFHTHIDTKYNSASILLKHMSREYFRVIDSIRFSLSSSCTYIDNITYKNTNKINQLKIAHEKGMLIPKTIITNSKMKLETFFNDCKQNVISKPVGNIFSFNLNNNNNKYFTYTKAIKSDIFKFLPNSFFPSLFQEKIEIEIEIRVFYLDGKCYSGALFYQTDGETIDWRINSYSNNLRILPFLLPRIIEDKLDNIAKSLGLLTCSFDLLLGRNGKFYFLECNPQGQFGFLSKQCNYGLESIFANFLIQKIDKNEKKIY